MTDVIGTMANIHYKPSAQLIVLHSPCYFIFTVTFQVGSIIIFICREATKTLRG